MNKPSLTIAEFQEQFSDLYSDFILSKAYELDEAENSDRVYYALRRAHDEIDNLTNRSITLKNRIKDENIENK